MISVNELITDALQKTNLIGDSEEASGTLAKIALRELHGVIGELNEEDYLEEWFITKTCTTTNKIVIGTSDTCDIKVKVLPSKLISLSRRIGDRYCELNKCNKTDLYSLNRKSIPHVYTSDIMYNEEDDEMQLVIETDSSVPTEYLIICKAGIPDYELTDYITLSKRYETVLGDGLCVKLAIRYKLLESLSVFEDEYTVSKSLIKNTNTINRPLTNINTMGSYLDNYYNALNGEGW